MLKKRINSFFTVGWNIAYRKKGDKTFNIIDNVKTSWAADPFVFEYNGEVYIFAELLNYKRGKGCIGYSKLENGNFTPWKEVIIEKYHLSFPNIKEENGNIYIYPETNEDNSFYRYKAINFPDTWEKEKIYINDMQIVDSIFFKYDNDKYFMTYDIKKEPKKLLLFNVKDDEILLNTKQVLNDNDEEARPAGNILVEDNKYIRVAQNCVDFYGKSLKFFEFKINNNKYKEKLIKEINISDVIINKKMKFHGIHTYNISNNYEVVDLKFKRFLLYSVIQRIKRKIKRIIHK